MCRFPAKCPELSDRSTWSQKAPLPAPRWIRSYVPAFARAVRLAAEGNTLESRRVLARIPNARIWERGRSHGKQAGNQRNRALGEPQSERSRKPSGPRDPQFLANSVYARDSYKCRYCDLPVVPVAVLRAFSAVVGTRHFSFGSNDHERTGIGLLMWAQLDHVLPYSAGGRTSPANVVTCCWGCNFAKGNYTLRELGLEDPRKRPPSRSRWSGLTSLRQALEGLQA
jgi:5-methylcytosine-specific restriction endonuclease McrA